MPYIVEDFQESNKFDYFCMMYNVKVHHDKTYKLHEEVNKDVEPRFIRMTRREEEGQNVIKANSECERIMVIPQLLREGEQERDVVYINGASGIGKSWFVNLFCKLYHLFYPNNKIFFLTLNDFKGDKSLTHSLYIELNLNDFIEQMSETDDNGESGLEKFSKSHDVSKCMFVFDDIGVLKNDKKKEKMCWNIIDCILENKRKAMISVAVISHISTNYRQTALITREAKNYVFSAKNLQTLSDRMLRTYLGLTSKQLSWIMNHLDDSRWVSLNSSTKTIITQFLVCSLKESK